MKPVLSTAVICCAGLGLGSTAWGEVLLSIYPVQTEQLDEETAGQVDALLRHEMGQLPGLVVHSRAKTRRAIDRIAGREGDCGGRLECLLEVGELSAAKLLVYGTVTRVDAGFRLGLTLLDVEQESIVKRRSAVLTGSAADISGRMREVLIQLVIPTQFSGTLKVKMLVPGARVLVDGLEVGTTPTTPITGLIPRDYELGVVLKGCAPLSRTVPIRHGATTSVTVRVVGKHLRAKVEHGESLLAPGPVSEAAGDLAAKLKQAAPAAPSAPEPSAPESPSNEAQVARAVHPEADGELTPSAYAGIALAAGGAVVGLVGGVGLGMFGFAQSRVESAMHNGVVTDRETYVAIDRDRDLYDSLGVAGAIALPVGAAALAVGVGLLAWELAEVAGEEGGGSLE